MLPIFPIFIVSGIALHYKALKSPSHKKMANMTDIYMVEYQKVNRLGKCAALANKMGNAELHEVE